MARMHSRDKGKSGSTRPLENKKKSWLNYKEKEVESLVVKLAKQGVTSSLIGLTLRDSYGIPDVKIITKQSITQILKNNKLQQEIPEDLLDLLKREAKLVKHIETNKQDKTAKRGIQLTESKIKRLSKYYKKTNKLPKNWKYDRSKIGLLIN